MVKISETRFGQEADFVRMTSLIVDRKTDVISGQRYARSYYSDTVISSYSDIYSSVVFFFLLTAFVVFEFRQMSGFRLKKHADTGKQTSKHTDRDRPDRQTDRETDSGTDRQRQTGRQAVRCKILFKIVLKNNI